MKRLSTLITLACVFHFGYAQEREVRFGIHTVSLGYVASSIFVSGAPFGGETNMTLFQTDRFQAGVGMAFRYSGTKIYDSDVNIIFDAPSGRYYESTERFFEAQLSLEYKAMEQRLFRFYMGPVFRFGRYYAHVIETPSVFSSAVFERNRRVSYRGAGVLLKQYYGNGEKWQFYSAQSLSWDYFHPHGFYLDGDLRLGIQRRLFSR